MKSIYGTNGQGEAAMRVSSTVTGQKDSIYGVDENGNAAVRVIGGTPGASGGTSGPVVTANNLMVTLTGLDANGDRFETTQSVADHLQTLKNDDAEKGDAIQGIQQLIPESATSSNPLITANDLPTGTASDDYGIRGDYCATYGVVETPYGRPRLGAVGSNKIIVPAGIRIEMPRSSLITIASQVEIEVPLGITCYMVYIPDLDEPYQFCEQLCFKKTKPAESDATCRVWFDGQDWYYRSINMGDTWIKVGRAQPMARCVFVDGNLVRLDFIGWYHDTYRAPTTAE